ncbi:S-layer homology domain-containing protein [Phormidium tenue FACHB-886]|nr:S-layer homology domain-containing protein [Phormidium tenue FACHB-886]
MRSSVWLIGLTVGVVLPLGACSNSPWAANLERSLAADPRLATNPVAFESSPSPSVAASPPSNSISASPTAQLPANFPGEIPRYPNAQLIGVNLTSATQPSAGDAAPATETRWSTTDSPAQVQRFYQDRLRAEGWQLTPASPTVGITAQRDGLRMAIATASAADSTEFTIRYQFQEDGAIASASPAAPTASAGSSGVQPGDPEFVGPTPPADWVAKPPTAVMASLPFKDLNQAPSELQQYVTDLANLGALPLQGRSSSAGESPSPSSQPNANPSSSSSQLFKPNQPITRREYARWLVAANNLIYASQPSRQIRLGAASETPAFTDVPTSDPDFGAIQGLANAGLISSSLSGEPAKAFRPDAPLTREEMILWKVPVDIRRSLPTANLDAVQQTWGFQDAPKIDPKALRAVLADYQNGDLANIRRAFGYTTLFQPQKAVTRAEAAAALWYFGAQGDGLSAKDALQISRPSQPAEG